MKRLFAIGAIFLSAIFFFGCGQNQEEIDAVPPKVVSTIPAMGIEGASVDSEISMTFDEDVVPMFFLVNIDKGSLVAGQILNFGRTISFKPDKKLEYETVYEIYVSVMDLSGNKKDFFWSFTTEALPKWTLPDSYKIFSADINKNTGEIYAVVCESFHEDNRTWHLVKFSDGGKIVFDNKELAQIPGFIIGLVDYIKVSPDGNIIYLFWRKLGMPTVLYPGALSDGLAVSAYNSNGSHLWTTEITNKPGGPLAFAADKTGAYAVVIAIYKDPMAFKINTSGEIVWQAMTIPTDGATHIWGVYANDGHVYFTGGTLSNIIPGQLSAGSWDVIVAKYSAENGDSVWMKQWGTAYSDTGYGITVVPGGDFAGIYISGIVENSGPVIPADPNAPIISGAGIEEGAFVKKYDFDGNLVWTSNLGNYKNENSGLMASPIIASSDGLYVGGARLSKVGFDGNLIWKSAFSPGRIMVCKDTIFAVLNGSIVRYDANAQIIIQ